MLSFAHTIALPLLHIPTPAELWWIPRPDESHHVFGAGLIFVAALIVIESVAGGVWHRSMLRRMLFPAILVFLGIGMVLVSLIEPYARVVHLTMGLPMMAGGWAEARYRMGLMERRYADALVVPALVLAAADTLAFHLSGERLVVVSHAILGVLVILLAGLRLYQSGRPSSVSRSLLMSLVIALIGLDLWLDAFFQTST